ncbi:MAG TPA: leucyl/phenylalanyl-tRNA--protein transferase [Steroidobacteraceae bacterium]|nr:leucyl/phenylalanyl-tRNA--protein transferase [Steroidobacteraceae bacterium]
MSQLAWLSDTHDLTWFPPVSSALRDPDGLLAAGGGLSIERLLAAYRRGIFPWYNEGQPVLWWSPDPRSVLIPQELRCSRSLRKSLRNRGYRTSIDTAFVEVVAACAEPRASGPGTWITADMAAAYAELHTRGFAHSIETWREGVLAGGLYGVALGRVFFGESMFSRATDASKVALVRLAEECNARKIELIDCQVASAHIATLGSRLLPRAEFIRRIGELTAGEDSWRPA